MPITFLPVPCVVLFIVIPSGARRPVEKRFPWHYRLRQCSGGQMTEAMGSVDMSLDDIISMNRKMKQSKPAQQRSSRGGGGKFGRKSGGFEERRPRYKDLDAPENTGFDRKPSLGGSNGNKIVRINLSNLANSVVSADLEELFADYNIETAAVHYNENGESLGTGDVFMRRKDAVRAVTDFAGVALDNMVMRMVLVDTNQITQRVQFPQRQGTTGGGVQRRNRGGFRREPRKQQTGGAVRSKQPQKSMEELDAELDAYMKKSKE